MHARFGCLVLMRHTPGIWKTPEALTSLEATAVRLSRNFTATFFFTSTLLAKASARPPFVKALPPVFFMVLAVFMGVAGILTGVWGEALGQK